MAPLLWWGAQIVHLQNTFAVDVSQRHNQESINLWEVSTETKDCLKHFGQDNTGVGKEQVLIIFAFKI